MFHAVIGCRSVPVFLAWRNPDRVAGAHLTDRSAPRLNVADAGNNRQSLSEWMAVPERARARLEAYPTGAQQRGIGRLDNRILPHCSGEARCRPFTRRPRSARDNFHDDLLPIPAFL